MIVCAKKHADRLSFDKGYDLCTCLKECQDKFLEDSDIGLQAGENGAWIEIGYRKTLSNFVLLGKYYAKNENKKHTLGNEKMMDSISDMVNGSKRMTKFDLNNKDTSARISKLMNNSFKAQNVMK